MPYNLNSSENILKNEKIAIPTDSGHLYIFDINNLYNDNIIVPIKHEQLNLTSITGCFWFNNDKYLCTYSNDHTISILDYERFDNLYNLIGHTSDIKYVDYNVRNNNILVSASRDGNVKLWDIRQSIYYLIRE